MMVTIHNRFHENTCRVRVPVLPALLSPGQSEKVKALCGHADCHCGSYYEATRDDTGERVNITPPCLLGS